MFTGEWSLLDPPKEQRPRNLSGKRTVNIKKHLERSHFKTVSRGSPKGMNLYKSVVGVQKLSGTVTDGAAFGIIDSKENTYAAYRRHWFRDHRGHISL